MKIKKLLGKNNKKKDFIQKLRKRIKNKKIMNLKKKLHKHNECV